MPHRRRDRDREEGLERTCRAVVLIVLVELEMSCTRRILRQFRTGMSGVVWLPGRSDSSTLLVPVVLTRALIRRLRHTVPTTGIVTPQMASMCRRSLAVASNAQAEFRARPDVAYNNCTVVLRARTCRAATAIWRGNQPRRCGARFVHEVLPSRCRNRPLGGAFTRHAEFSLSRHK